MEKLPPHIDPSENITLLSIMPAEEDRHALKRMLSQDGWNLEGVRSVREASYFLASGNPQVILCDPDLPDGSWKDVLRLTHRAENPAAVVVASRHSDGRFWAEVLNLGAYDVVLKPFDGSEVQRVLKMALRQLQPMAFAHAGV